MILNKKELSIRICKTLVGSRKGLSPIIPERDDRDRNLSSLDYSRLSYHMYIHNLDDLSIYYLYSSKSKVRRKINGRELLHRQMPLITFSRCEFTLIFLFKVDTDDLLENRTLIT